MENIPNYIDIALMGILAFFTIKALVRGFGREALGLIGIVVAVVISGMTYEPLGQLLQAIVGDKGEYWHLVALVLVLIAIFVIFSYIGSIISRLVQSGALSLFDRILGCGIGLVKGILITYLLVNVLLLTSPWQVPTKLRDSAVAPHVVTAGSKLMDLVPHDLFRKLQERSGLLPTRSDRDLKKSE